MFDVDLAAPVDGVGALETAFSQDHYVFSLAAPATVAVDAQVCPGNLWLKWSIVDSNDVSQVSKSYCGDGEVDLPAGDYTVIVEPQNGTTGNYQLQLSSVVS